MTEVPESLRSFQLTKIFHKTWAGTFFCQPHAIFQPTNLDELKELVKQAKLNGKTIMTVGSGHSPSDMTMTNDWLCNLDKLNKVLKVETKPGNPFPSHEVTVEAGIRIYQLNDFLRENGLAIQNLGSISEQSIAGLISTGTHGSSPNHGLVSLQVKSLKVLNSSGEEVYASQEENVDVFRAALCSVGKIGIITEVTLRVSTSFNLKSRQEIINFSTLLNKWDTLWLESEFIRIWWFPYTEKCVLWRADKSDEPLSDPRPSWYGTRLGRFFYESLLFVSVHLFPRLTPYVERFVFTQQYGNVETLGSGDIAVQDSVDGLNMDCLFSQFVNEWSAPLNTGVDTLTKLQDVIKAAAKTGEFFVHAPIEVRCSNVTYPEDEQLPELHPWDKAEALYRGPLWGNSVRPFLDNSPQLPYPKNGKVTNDNLTLFINATMYRPFGTNVETRQWFQLFEDIMLGAGGKPHWAKNFIGLDGDHQTPEDLQSQLAYGGKEFYTMIGFDPVMKRWFGDSLVKFNEVRRQLDPDGVFLSGKQWAVRNGLVIE